jgi:hypothetical protein
MPSSYWSCSKFADWLRGTHKPHSGTEEMWAAWEKTAKIKKYRYWLAEEGLDHLQNVLFFPKRCMNDLYRYIHNRWVCKSHALTSRLKRGQWHDFDTRLLHSVFDELVNFVEIELAWMEIVCSEESCKKYKSAGYRRLFHLGSWRCAEAGIAYLNWAETLQEEGLDKNNPGYGLPTDQALAARQVHQLYRWWKEERPRRPDPGEASGWDAYCEEKRKIAEAQGEGWWFFSNTKGDERSLDLLSKHHQIQQDQEDEDTAMLVKLVKLRRSLWT